MTSTISLPPALPTGNATNLCNFTNRNAMLERIDKDWINYNISLLVQTCSSVCPLVYGSGNPDISGPGAMVTYVLQAITTLLFGPMVALFAIYTQTDAWSTGSSSKPKHRFQELISNLAFSVFQANVFACLAVSIGCLVREVEISPLAEVSFINTLGVLEMMILLGIVLSATACYDYTSRYLIVMFIYGVPVFAFSMAVTLLRGYPSSQTKILEKITGFCIEERDYPFFSMRDDDARTNRFLGIFMGSFYGGIFALIIIWMLIYKYCKPIANPIIKVYEAVTGFFLNLWKRFARLLHADPGRLFFGIAATFYGVVWAYSSIVLLISLQNQRISLQRVLGAAYEDSQWGFGQITAIILWAPLLHDLIMEIIDYFKPPKKEKTAEHKSTDAQDRWYGPSGAHQSRGRRQANRRDRQKTNTNPSGSMAQPLLTASDDDEINMTFERQNTEDTLGLKATEPADGMAPPVPRMLTGNGQIGNAAATTSSQPGTPGLRVDEDGIEMGVRQRPSWPRNVDGTYLPRSNPSSPLDGGRRS